MKMAERIGAQPPAALVELFKLTRLDVLAACGLNPSLFDIAPGVSQRESYRQMLYSVVSPLGRMIAFECTEKLGASVTLDWAELRAGDIAGHARAFSSMVQGGIPVERAAACRGCWPRIRLCPAGDAVTASEPAAAFAASGAGYAGRFRPDYANG